MLSVVPRWEETTSYTRDLFQKIKQDIEQYREACQATVLLTNTILEQKEAKLSSEFLSQDLLPVPVKCNLVKEKFVQEECRQCRHVCNVKSHQRRIKLCREKN